MPTKELAGLMKIKEGYAHSVQGADGVCGRMGRRWNSRYCYNRGDAYSLTVALER